jgi:hypothetical protein
MMVASGGGAGTNVGVSVESQLPLKGVAVGVAGAANAALAIIMATTANNIADSRRDFILLLLRHRFGI